MADQPVIVQQQDLAWESRDVYKETPLGRVRWKTLLSGDCTPTAGLTHGIVEIPPGERLSIHKHTAAESYYVISGEGFVLLNGERQKVSAGSAVFIPSEVVHTIGATGEQLLVVFYSFPVDSFNQVDYQYQ